MVIGLHGIVTDEINNFMKIHTFESFVNEDYFADLSKSTADKKKAQMKKQGAMDDDDPDAYKELPGDTKGKKNLKISRHTKKYQDLYVQSFSLIECEIEAKHKTSLHFRQESSRDFHTSHQSYLSVD